MDGIHQPLIEEDSDSIPVIIQSQKKTRSFSFCTFDALMVKNVCKIHVSRSNLSTTAKQQMP